MANPLEVFFSVYLTLRPPFLACLSREKFLLSDQITIKLFRKQNGLLVKCDLNRNSRRNSDLIPGGSIRAVCIIDPSDILCSVLYNRASVSPFYYSGYQWKWTEDGKTLRMYDEGASFHMNYEEASLLAEIIKSNIHREE